MNEEENVSPKTPGLVDILADELRELALNGAAIKKKISEAKTSHKKKLYKKKLEKNSQRAAELIMYLERVQIGKAIQNNKDKQQLIDVRDTNESELFVASDSGEHASPTVEPRKS